MPAQHQRARRGLAKGTGRGGIPHPGQGGYDYPRGPYGATGFPGSTPATLGRIRKSQGTEGRRDRQLSSSAAQARDTGPEMIGSQQPPVPRPQPSYGRNPFRPGGQPAPGNKFLARSGSPRQPKVRNQRLATGYEHREVPAIGNMGLVFKPPRNAVAQRWKAPPGQVRAYRPAPNPAKTGARMAGPSQYHPGVTVYGAPDGKPVPGMASNPDGTPPQVTVMSRYVSRPQDGWAQEGYAMDRPMLFTRGGTPAAQPHGADPHIRGARMSGQRYFGALADQQKIGLRSDSYGIARKRGPRHRPVRFETPSPWTANYYDVPGHQGSEDPDMIHRSPVVPRVSESRRARRGPRRTGRR